VVNETSVFDPRSYKSVQRAGKRSNFWMALLADDAALTTQKEEELQPMMDAFVEATNPFGLTISIPKTEVLATKPNVTMTIEGKVLKQTDMFKYLGGEVADGCVVAGK
jgi:hypothetical protein